MKNLYILKYRLKYGDKKLKQQINLIKIFVIVILIVPIIYFFKPFSLLKENLENKSKNLSANNNLINELTTPVYSSVSNITTPLNGVLTNAYGGNHTGVDIQGKHHDNIIVIDDGIVTFAGSQNGYGNCIEIKHEKNGETYYSFYAHLSKILVSNGKQVKKGDIIGIEGGQPGVDPNPGNSTGHHLHFEIRTANRIWSSC